MAQPLYQAQQQQSHSMKEESSFQIRLSGHIPASNTILPPKIQRYTVTIIPTLTMDELHTTTRSLFFPTNDYSHRVEFYTGFPPKPIALPSINWESCLVKDWIRGGESVLVKFIPDYDRPTADPVHTKRPRAHHHQQQQPPPRTIQTTATTTRSTDKRKAPTALTSTTDKKLNNSARNDSCSASSSFKATEARAAAANSRRLANLPGGRSLVDRAIADTNNVKRAAGNNKKRTNDDEVDICSTLLSSIQSKQKVGQVLRTAMKNAVQKSYEASRAQVRVSAVQGGLVQFTKQQHAATTNKLIETYTVTYAKGMEGRGLFEEIVEIIPIEALKAVLTAVYDDGREMLRPVHMAQLSPRVFWSLVLHYQTQCRSIEDALKTILPELDWTFLQGRTKTLSEKARENLRQERAQRGEEEEDYDAGVQAVEAVQEAMMENENTTVREKMAQAALARFGRLSHSSNNSTEWKLVTPTEVDTDELCECIIEGSTNVSKGSVQNWISVLVEKCCIHNWRELANAESATLHSTLFQSFSTSRQVLDAIIEAAQLRTIDEIMLEILQGNEEALVVLREEARAGTPKDLALWSAIPSMLLEEAPSLQATAAEVREWCAKARVALQELEWLNWYATPIANT